MLIFHICSDKKKSFFVGDAAGRPCGWRQGASKDFASTDRKFAINVGISFFTPEEFFLNHPTASYDLGPLDPSKFFEWTDSPHHHLNFGVWEKALIIFVGPPASGKTTLYHDTLEGHGFVRISQDVLRSYQACITKAREAMMKSQPLVIGINRFLKF